MRDVADFNFDVNAKMPLNEIAERTAYACGVTVRAMRHPSKRQDHVKARRMFSIIARREGFTVDQISTFIEKHYSTVIHLLQGIKREDIRCPHCGRLYDDIIKEVE